VHAHGQGTLRATPAKTRRMPGPNADSQTVARQVFRAHGEPRKAGEPTYCGSCGRPGLQWKGTAGSCTGCRAIHYRNAVPTVAVLIVQGAAIVLCRRRPSAFQGGLWCLPSGHVDFDEDFLTAAHREVREETGLTIRLSGIVNVTSNFLSPGVQSLCVVLVARPVGGRLQAGDDAAEAVWHQWPAPLPEMAFEADASIIERYFVAPFDGLPVEGRFAGPPG
jgi:8-oxo-dGTP diphosphatase